MQERRTDFARRPMATSLALYALLVVASGLREGHRYTGDSQFLIRGTRVALDCLRDGTYRRCGLEADGITTAVHPFALLQYLLAAPFASFHASEDVIMGVFIAANLAAVAATVVTVVRLTAPCAPWLRYLAVMAVLGSTLPYHATSTFGEPLGALATVLALLTVLRQKRAVLVVAAFAVSTMAKETSLPFLVLTGVCGVLLSRPKDRGAAPSITPTATPRRNVWWIRGLPIAFGIGIGTFANTVFNLFRYGTASNPFYGLKEFRTPLTRVPEFMAELWVSPASGLFLTWPVFSFLAVLVLVRAASFRSADLRHRLSPGYGFELWSIAALVVGMTVGLSLWYTPFGWVALGPRLCVPTLPSLIVLLVLFLDRRGAVHAPKSWSLRALLLPILSLGVLGMCTPWLQGDALLRLKRPENSCGWIGDISPLLDETTYYRCARSFLWRWRPPPLLGAVGDRMGPALVLAAVLAALFTVSGLFWVRQQERALRTVP